MTKAHMLNIAQHISHLPEGATVTPVPKPTPEEWEAINALVRDIRAARETPEEPDDDRGQDDEA